MLRMLNDFGMSFCTHDLQGMTCPRAAVGPIAYVRFHGTAGKYVGRYSEEALAQWSDWMIEQSEEGREVWAYFNNDIFGHAIADALALKRLIPA
jgi:uncharacterized protein YecE (DUF72 family)